MLFMMMMVMVMVGRRMKMMTTATNQKPAGFSLVSTQGSIKGDPAVSFPQKQNHSGRRLRLVLKKEFGKIEKIGCRGGLLPSYCLAPPLVPSFGHL